MANDGTEWVRTGVRVPAAEAGERLPDKPGLYAAFLRESGSLPEEFATVLAGRLCPDLLYVGQASVSLRQRVWVQELQHKSPGTFFRSVGVMLGYVSPTGGKNFEFAPPDKAAITAWMAQHLAIGWTTQIEVSPDDDETAIIQAFHPLLNIKGNPKKLARLTALRAISKQGRGKPLV